MARKLIKEKEGTKRHSEIYRMNPALAEAFLDESKSLWVKYSVQRLTPEIFVREFVDCSADEATVKILERRFQFYSIALREDKFSEKKYSDGIYWEFCASGMEDGEELFLFIEFTNLDGKKFIEKYFEK